MRVGVPDSWHAIGMILVIPAILFAPTKKSRTQPYTLMQVVLRGYRSYLHLVQQEAWDTGASRARVPPRGKHGAPELEPLEVGGRCPGQGSEGQDYRRRRIGNAGRGVSRLRPDSGLHLGFRSPRPWCGSRCILTLTFDRMLSCLCFHLSVGFYPWSGR